MVSNLNLQNPKLNEEDVEADSRGKNSAGFRGDGAEIRGTDVDGTVLDFIRGEGCRLQRLAMDHEAQAVANAGRDVEAWHVVEIRGASLGDESGENLAVLAGDLAFPHDALIALEKADAEGRRSGRGFRCVACGDVGSGNGFAFRVPCQGKMAAVPFP